MNFQILPSVMKKAVAEEDDIPQVFDRPVDCSFRLEMVGTDVFVSGEAKTTVHPTCARCGEVFARDMTVGTSITCRPATREVPGGDSYQESEEGLVFFRHEEIDLDEIVREQVLLALPMRYLCSENCRGLCPACGANLNLDAHVCTLKAAAKQ